MGSWKRSFLKPIVLVFLIACSLLFFSKISSLFFVVSFPLLLEASDGEMFNELLAVLVFRLLSCGVVHLR